MKLNLTTKFLSTLIVMLLSIAVIAQPVNDNACDAIDVTNMSYFLETNEGATVQFGESVITPPTLAGCAPGGWCDATGIDNSVWFKFDAPADGSVFIDACQSDFDNQMAVYEVGDCNNFNSFTFIWGADDTPENASCGPADGDEYSLASSFELECLTPGQTYYILIDGWQNSAMDADIVGVINMEVTAITPTNTATVLEVESSDPECMGGSNGSASIAVTEGRPPFSIEWGDGSTETSLGDLSAGDYTVSVTDGCGEVATQTITINDGPAPTQIITLLPESNVVHPTGCSDETVENGDDGNDGQITVGVSSGTGPFTMIWSTGDTATYLNNLAAGDYTVTISDACGNPPAVETFTLTTGEGAAGPDVEVTCGDTAELGGGTGVGQVSQLNMDTDNGELVGNVACRFSIDDVSYLTQNTYLRAFDLDADFSLSGPVQIAGVDFILFAISPPGAGGLQPVNFKLHTADNTDLTMATLTEIASLSTMVPDMSYEYFRANLNATVDASEILVVEISHPGSNDDFNYRFDAAAIEGVVPQPTYLASDDCGGISPTLMTDIGFERQIIMNIIARDSSGDTYAWDDPDGNLSATDVPNPSLTVDAPGTYTVTITDACGNSVVDDVMVDCGVGIVNPEDAVFAISPNPSNGIFQLQNTDVAKNIMLQVFDLQGKMIQTEQFNNTLHTLDLSAYPAGVYVLKLDNGVDVETHKLLVH